MIKKLFLLFYSQGSYQGSQFKCHSPTMDKDTNTNKFQSMKDKGTV